MASVLIAWIPLGAGGTPVVRWSGRAYEWIVARRHGRRPRPLYHSALRVDLDDGTTYAVEMTPAWGNREPDRGVVAEGPVGVRRLGRSRLFRYEVRRWRNGTIPDLDAAERIQMFPVPDDRVRRLLGLVPAVPPLTWGRDEAGTGEMWNSNSVVSWLLARSALPVGAEPPHDGRAPGWTAGLAVAERTPVRQQAGGAS
jgi:hypothetical protein